MGYACPVCGDPQMDGAHLANHLAISAVMGREDHETWLDDRVPGWGQQGPEELAPRVTEYAAEREFPQVFEDTTDQGHGHGHDHEDHAGAGGSLEQRLAEQASHRGRGAMTVDEDVYAEARRLTAAMAAEGESGTDGNGADESGPDGSGPADDAAESDGSDPATDDENDRTTDDDNARATDDDPTGDGKE